MADTNALPMLRLLVVALLVLVTGRHAEAAKCSWQVSFPPNLDQHFNYLGAIATLGPSDVWASGVYAAASGFAATQVVHFDGTSWSQSTPPSDQFTIESLSAFSDDDIWAVGYSSNRGINQAPATLHWNGTQWQAVSNPAQTGNGVLYSSVGLPNGEVWAAGFINAEKYIEPLIEHFDGHVWQEDSVYLPPTNSVMEAIAGTSPKNLWAGGYGGSGGAFIERRLHRGNWVQSPTTFGNVVGSMSARSAREVWAVGPPSLGVFVLEWTGQQWNNIAYPRSGNLVVPSVNAQSKTNYTWFAGFYDNGQGRKGFVDRYRRGKWEDTGLPTVGSYDTAPEAIAAIPGRSDMWTVGTYSNVANDSLNLAEHWACPRGAE